MVPELKIMIYRESKNAVIPTVAYNGTSANFDITATETITIPAKGSAMVENGLRIMVPYGWYITLNTRSGHGIKKDLMCFRGIIDTGYTGPLGVKVFNFSDKDVVIEAGERYVQASFHKVQPVEFVEIFEDEFKSIQENSERGDKGWGSTGR